MKEKKIEVFCEQCGSKVGLDLTSCPDCASRLGDIECTRCYYIGIVSKFQNGCPNCNLNPFKARKEALKQELKNKVSYRYLKLPDFRFSLISNLLLYLIVCFFITLFFVSIIFY